VDGGRLRGDGGKVTWDLNGLPEGTYTASVEANAGNNLVAYDKTTVKVAHCTDCVWGESRCPAVSVSCPSGADSKKPVVFEASVAGGDWEVKPSYTWSLTAGKIMTGQGTTKITLNVSELAGKSVTATVIVGGFDTECTGHRRPVLFSLLSNGFPQKSESHLDRVSTGSGSDLVNRENQELLERSHADH